MGKTRSFTLLPVTFSLSARILQRMSAPITTLSPEAAWVPFEPTWDTPWDLRRAAHLYRRAGMGASRATLDRALQYSPQQAVESLLNPQPQPTFDADMQAMSAVVTATNDPQRLAAFWALRMLQTGDPLRERMTLFWHGHFATGASKVKNSKLMLQQHELLRREALGSFQRMALGISRDPAMLMYLDATDNRKSHPNENFARELMELFCLGVDEYTEKDIQELARCLTGWVVRYGGIRFLRHLHDTGSKEVLGRRGTFGDEAAVRIVLEHPACGHFIARKLIRTFIADEGEIPKSLTQPLADTLRQHEFELRPLIQQLLGSRLFFESVGRKIRSPIDVGIGLMRSLEASGNAEMLARRMSQLGLGLFHPPNVKGWVGGRNWIHSSTLLGRANLIERLLHDEHSHFGTARNFRAWCATQGLTSASPSERIEWFCSLLLTQNPPAATRKNLESLADNPEKLLHAICCLPEFQLA